MKLNKRSEAIALRSNGKSMRQIALELNVAKSSVSRWVRHVDLTEAQHATLSKGREKGWRAVSRLAKERHLAYRTSGRVMCENDIDFRVICALYWGEGTKTGGCFKVSNCDPRMLRVVCNWLDSNGYGDIKGFRVHYHRENGLSEQEIAEWWMLNLPSITSSHLKKFTVFKPRPHLPNHGKAKHKSPYGVGVVEVNRTELLQKALGGVEYLASL